jgi:hypothetical protein
VALFPNNPSLVIGTEKPNQTILVAGVGRVSGEEELLSVQIMTTAVNLVVLVSKVLLLVVALRLQNNLIFTNVNVIVKISILFQNQVVHKK